MSRTETETVTALEMYVMRYFDAIEMSDAKKLVEGFREFLAQNPHTGQIIRKPNPEEPPELTCNWRQGRSVRRTIYVNDVLIGMVDTPELAASIVSAMNHKP